MKRKIITIKEELCDGCGNCVTACSEGALKIVNGKAKLVKEDFCDGFGDCIGECPTGALTIKERESKPFDIEATKAYLLDTKGKEAVWRMEDSQKKHTIKEHLPCGCPGSLVQTIKMKKPGAEATYQKAYPQLRNWPVQLSLLPLKAPYYQGTDLLIAADCCAYAYAGFHNEFMKNHTVAVGCPKLDNTDAYREKLATILSDNNIKSVYITYMEVPCCNGLVKLVEDAAKASGKDIPITKTQIGIKGQVLSKTQSSKTK